MKVVKHCGDIVEFNEEKLRNSLMKSGANKEVVDRILKTIEGQMYEGITTKQIYKLAFLWLKKSAKSNAARYNLKAAIRMLGPAGFFFEKYIARLFAAEHYEIKSNLILKGHCVNHEIDLLVKKNNVVSMVECKFHMGEDASSDVKVPMYIFSRFNDLKPNKHPIFSGRDSIAHCWIVTNNRFTSDAINFANCSKINLLSWNYPPDNNLKTRNDNNRLYPVTCLTTLTHAEKEKLLILDVILVKELRNNSDALEKIGLSSNRIRNVLKEVNSLCEYY